MRENKFDQRLKYKVSKKIFFLVFGLLNILKNKKSPFSYTLSTLCIFKWALYIFQFFFSSSEFLRLDKIKISDETAAVTTSFPAVFEITSTTTTVSGE